MKIVFQPCYICRQKNLDEKEWRLELVSEELNHFGLSAGLFRQITGWFVLFALFENFSLKLIFLKFFFISLKSNPWHKYAKWSLSDLTPWTLTLGWSQGETHFMHFFVRKHGITTFLHLHLHHISSACPNLTSVITN